MAIDYALHCDEMEHLPCPDALVLMSPAIAVTPLAALVGSHAALSWMPFFEKFAWLSILPEIDPFKFTSFPKRAGSEIHRISTRMYAQLKDATQAGKLPPILTFQSVVDNTVSASGIVSRLYDRLPENGSELVIYDVNRSSTVLHLMNRMPGDPADFFQSAAPSHYKVKILRNRNRNGAEINTFTLAAGETIPVIERTPFAWPEGSYSLSHIAVPFRVDDLVYGDGSSKGAGGIAFGAIAPRGEAGVLLLSSDYFLRARYNPFFSFQADYLTEWLHSL